ncbi:hypothetical protein C8J56DRAFT_808383 [Mycena floridula]|nr:hypothetical protein C8J56DRAFT_808383 [Mycena floridula]
MLVLKIWSLGFRGNGRTKYAYEMLHIIHNLTHVWPQSIRDIVFNNWLVNPTGRLFAFVEIDLMQEHNNFWIKTFYKAHGGAASWEWLEMVSPCINILRQLSTTMNGLLGSYQGTKHKTPDLRHDIEVLMTSLEEHDVYKVKKGRVLDEDDPPVKDVLAVGLQALTDSSGNPLDEYNKAFKRLQARRVLKPIIGGPESDPISATATDNVAPTILISTTLPESNSGAQSSLQLAENHTCNSDSGSASSSSESSSESEDELDGEFVQILQADDEPTLQRIHAEDVSLNMDSDIESEDEGDGSGSEDYDDDE